MGELSVVRFSIEDVIGRAGDTKFMRTCLVHMPISMDAIKKLCLHFPVIPPELKSVLVDLTQRMLPAYHRSRNPELFNCWATFEPVYVSGGLMLYTSPTFITWARISKTQVYIDPNKQLHLGVSRRAMQLNHV